MWLQSKYLSTSRWLTLFIMFEDSWPTTNWFSVMWWFVLHVIWGTFAGQRYVDEVLRPHALPIFRTVRHDFSLTERQFRFSCNMSRNCFKAGHATPPWLAFGSRYNSNRPPLGYLTTKDAWLISLPSWHITRIGTPTGWTMATHSTGGGIQCIHKRLLSITKRPI